MSDWYIQFKNQVKEKLEKLSADYYFIAVSGGRDSVFLFHLLKELLPLKKLVVLHLNHNLRGNLSDQDQIFVKNLSRQNGIICLSTKVTLEVLPGSGGLENVARITRYEWFKEKIANKNAIVFCGHTLDDHMETILMKLHRGSGLTGLKGISYQQEIMGVNVCRPLLFAERHQITQYLENKNIQWRDDHTNLNPEYFRNEVRINLIPQLSTSTKLRLVKLSALSSQLQSHFELLKGVKVSSGIEFSYFEIEKLSLFELRYLIEKIYRYFGLPSGPDKKQMDRVKLFLQEKKSHLQLTNHINISYSRQKIFFNQENKLAVTFMSEIEFRHCQSASEVNEATNDRIALELPEVIEPLVKWRWVDFSKDFWRGKSLHSFVKKLKVPPWRKIHIPLCEYNGEILFIGYLGVSKNYYNLISGQTKLVTIEVLNKKVSL